MNLDMIEFGKRLKSARMKSGLTQEQLSSLLNVSRTHLSKMEQGERGCSLDSLVEIAEVLNVSTDYLLTGKVYQKSIKRRLRMIISELQRLCDST